MTKKESIIMSWSGGKDSAFALHHLLQEGKYEVKYLLTNIFKPNKRVSMHGVPEILIEEQAKHIGIPLLKMYIQEKTHDEYEQKMEEFLLNLKKEGITKVAFGNIFLEDLKEYRENQLKKVDMTALFPLWNKDTTDLAQQFIDTGFKTHLCSIDTSKIPEDLIGLDYSTNFLTLLPKEVDPCGENGEFHTFCYDGPIYNTPVRFTKVGVVEKVYTHNKQDYKYLFSDIIPFIEK